MARLIYSAGSGAKHILERQATTGAHGARSHALFASTLDEPGGPGPVRQLARPAWARPSEI